MYAPIELQAQNFRLLRNLHYRFTDGVSFVAGRNNDVPTASSNMSGKTTLINCVPFVLYGCDVSGANIASSCTSHGEKSCTVSLRVSCPDKGTLLITRSRYEETKGSGGSRNVLTLRRSSKPNVSDDARMTEVFSGPAAQYQAQIDLLFGPQELFLAAHAYGTTVTSLPFACQSDKLQKNLFDMLIDNGDLVDAHAAATRVIAATQQSLAETRGGLAQVELEEANHKARLAALHAQASSVPETDPEQVTRLRDRADTLNQDVLHVRSRIKTTTALQSSVGRDLQESAISFRETSEKRTQVILGVSSTTLKLTEELATLQDTGNCVTCGRAYDRADAKSKVVLLQSKITALKQKGLALENELTDLRKKHERKHAALERAEQQHARELARHKSREQALLAELQQIETELKVCETRNEMTQANMRETLASLRRSRARRKQLIAHREKLQRRLDHATFWQDAFGAKGIRAYRLDSITPVLNSIAEQYSHALFGDGMVLRYSTLKHTTTGRTSEQFNVRLFDSKGKVCEVVSAGQAMRRDIINTLSMISLADYLGKRTLRIVLLDEIFQAIDAAGISAAVALLNAVAEQHGTMLLVEHNDELAVHFAQVLTIERNKECATLHCG